MSISLADAGKLVTIYVGIPIFIAGVLGGFLNIIVFLSLRTFRQNSCSFYLTVMSILNVGHLFFGLFSRLMITLYGVDGTETSVFYCKFRMYSFYLCGVTSVGCFCLATIDQYFATCSRPRWQQLCNIKLAQRLVIAIALIAMLHGIPNLIFFDHSVSPSTNKVSCINTNFVFGQYRIYVILLTLTGLLPVTLTALFGFLAYRNVQQLAYRTVPLVRRELDKQLTVMVLLQVLVNIFTLLPYSIFNTVATNIDLTKDPVIQANFQFTMIVTLMIFYIYFASPFYIYICASERFRRQFIHVLSKIHLIRCQRPRVHVNQVMPQTQ